MLDDFFFPGDDRPSGVVEPGSPDCARVIADLARLLERGFANEHQRTDCRYACSAWKRAFSQHRVIVQKLGGEGVDDDVHDASYRLVPEERRSGYREGDGRVHRHYWLAVGADLLLFDPTAHQFNDRGGVSLDRYIVEGRPFLEWRAEE